MSDLKKYVIFPLMVVILLLSLVQCTGDMRKKMVYYSAAHRYANTHQFEKAIINYTKAIEMDPYDPNVYFSRGLTYADIPRYKPNLSKHEKDEYLKKAIADYRKVIELNPNSASAYAWIGDAYCQMENWEEAIINCNKAIDMNANSFDKLASWTAYYFLGCTYYGKGDYDNALKDYTKAIKLAPNHAKTYYYRGKCYVDIGDLKSAISDFNKALKYDPDNQEYKNALSDAEKRLE